jgi:hypothetical protein
MPQIDQQQIGRGIDAMRATMEITFEGQNLVKPYDARLTLRRNENGGLVASCNKTGWFNRARVFTGDDQFKQLQDWLDGLIGHSQNLQFLTGR